MKAEVLTALCMLFQSQGATPAAEDLRVDSFLTRYRAALTSLRSYYGEARGEAIMSELFTRPGEAKPVRDRTHSVRYARVGDQVRMSLLLRREDGQDVSEYREIVYVVVPPKLFAVRRQSEDAPYALHFMGLEDKGNFGEFVDAIDKAFFLAPLSMKGISISEVVNSPGFSVTKLSRPGRDEKLLRVDFEFKPGPPPVRIVGHWLLDEGHGWVMREFEFARGDQPSGQRMVTTGSIRYEGDSEGLPAPHEVTIQRRFPKFQEHHSFKFAKFEHGPTPPSDFTLNAFGLGDLARPPGSGTNRTAYIVFGLAAMAVALGAALRLGIRARPVADASRGRPAN